MARDMRDRTPNYYVSSKTKLLRSFEKTARLSRGVVVSRYGETFANTLHREARQEFEALLPQLPYVGRVVLRTFLIISAQELAVYKVMKRYGYTAGEAWELCHDALRLRVDRIPKFVRWLLKRYFFSAVTRRRARKIAARTHREPIADFVLTFVEGDGRQFDFGVDYTGCTMNRFIREQGAPEFAPYVCLSDIALSEALGWGLIRSETLADGCPRCDFRFKKGGETRIFSPTPDVQATIERIRRRGAAPS